MANTNENLVYGWSNQQLGATAGQTGYAQPGNAPAVSSISAAEQASSGASAAPAPTAVAEVLTNPVYAVSPALMTPGPITAPTVPATNVGVQNPSGLQAQVTVTGGTLTNIQVAPNVNGAAGTYTIVGTTAGVYQVPGSGFIKWTGSGAPTWAWLAVN